MRKGYNLFGKAYEHMFRLDLHDQRSVEHKILKRMILLDEKSQKRLYKKSSPVSKKMINMNYFNYLRH